MSASRGPAGAALLALAAIPLQMHLARLYTLHAGDAEAAPDLPFVAVILAASVLPAARALLLGAIVGVGLGLVSLEPPEASAGGLGLGLAVALWLRRHGWTRERRTLLLAAAAASAVKEGAVWAFGGPAELPGLAASAGLRGALCVLLDAGLAAVLVGLGLGLGEGGARPHDHWPEAGATGFRSSRAAGRP